MLIISTCLTNNGFFTLANSVSDIINEETNAEPKETKNYYFEYLEEMYSYESIEYIDGIKAQSGNEEELESEELITESENEGMDKVETKPGPSFDGDEEEEESTEAEEPEDENDYIDDEVTETEDVNNETDIKPGIEPEDEESSSAENLEIESSEDITSEEGFESEAEAETKA